MPTPDIFTSVINSYLPEPHASLLNGIIFGVNLTTTKTFYEQLRAVGLLHIVVLSGMNITMLAAIVALTFERFGKRVSLVMTITTIVLFIAFVGPQAPVVRAGVMGILTLVAILYGLRTLSLYLLFLSAIFIGVIWPEWLTTISFQLSFGATAGIMFFGLVLPPRSDNLWDRFRFRLNRELRPSLAAQVFTVPIIFLYFKQISLISPISNVLVAPIIAPLMIFGFAAALLGKIYFALGLAPAYVCYGLLSYIIFVVEVLSKVPFGFIDFV